jgi:hypothetical protein
VTVINSDTHPELEDLQIQLIQRMPAWKKLAIVDSLNDTIKTLTISGIKQRHPDASPERVHRLMAENMLGVELAQQVYGYAR